MKLADKTGLLNWKDCLINRQNRCHKHNVLSSAYNCFNSSSFFFTLETVKRELTGYFLKLAKVAVLALVFFLISSSSTFAITMTDFGTYTGSYAFIDDGSNNWRIKFLSSGTFTPSSTIIIDVFLVGGGGGGSAGSSETSEGSGGGGGYTTYAKVRLYANTAYQIVIGAGGAGSTYYANRGSSGGSTTAFGISATGGGGGTTREGGNGGSGGAAWVGIGGSNGSDSNTRRPTHGLGQETTTYEFGETGSTLYAGGGGANGAGGAGGGGGTYGTDVSPYYGAGQNGTPNTGGGGGGGNSQKNSYGGNGGSGIVVMRNSKVTSYLYSGQSIFNQTNQQYKIKFLTSGTLILLNSNWPADVFLVGGGGGGSAGSSETSEGSGGGGGYTTYAKVRLYANTAYQIVIGAGGAGSTYYANRGSSGGSTTAFGISATGGGGGTTREGGNGGSGGAAWVGIGGSNGGNGSAYESMQAGLGQGGTTYEFRDSSLTLYAGGGGANGAGGAGGGGGTYGTDTSPYYGVGQNGTPNTGGGGGGGNSQKSSYGGNGGSGIVVMRVTDTTAPSHGTFQDANPRYFNTASGGTFRVHTAGAVDNFSGVAGTYLWVSTDLNSSGWANSWNILSQQKMNYWNDAGSSWYDVPVTVEGKYLIHTNVVDNAGNWIWNGPVEFVYIDRTPPVCGSWSSSVTGNTATMTLSSSTDALSGIATAGGTCTVTTHGGTCTVTISDNASNTTVCTSPIAVLDTSAPTGGSISYSTGPITKSNQVFAITVNDGSDDTGINISSRQLLRAEASYINGTCGTFSNYYPVPYTGTYPNITNTSFHVDRCYKYAWSVSDTANNNVIYNSSTIITTSSNTISLSKAPIGTVIKVNNLFFVKANTTGLLLSLQPYNYSYSSTFSYTGSSQTFTAPYSGWYQIEAWGAQGGALDIYSSSNNGGKGAYTNGSIYLQKDSQLTIYVGGAGTTITSPGSLVGLSNTSGSAVINGGYNGGGNGIDESDGTTLSGNETGTSGGGATDIRLSDSALTDRLMVAAGGSGAYNLNGTAYSGQPGGTLISSNADNTYFATQTSGNAFGQGINGAYFTHAGDWGSSGVGGGYYGGTNYSYPPSASGAYNVSSGGSSFISGYAGVNAITSSSSLTPTNQTLHYSHKYFIDGKMQAGVREGNGQAKITYLSNVKPARINTKLNNVRYIKDCATGNSSGDGYVTWVELQALVNGINVAFEKDIIDTTENANPNTNPYNVITDGIIDMNNRCNANSASQTLNRCITVDLGQVYNLDEIAVWHYWTDGRTYYNNVTSVSADNSTWTNVITTTEPETANGKRVSAY